MVRGQLSLNGKNLSAGDGAKIADESELQFLAAEEAEFLLFDLPPQA
jgi:redox-sensitive bicupin YhaK (pirin superfamily)